MTTPLPHGDTFTEGSAANHAALEELREVLLQIGFVVNKKSAKDSTLRVYLDKDRGYPLLNPRFLTRDPTGQAVECVSFNVLTKGAYEGLDLYLRGYSSSESGYYVPDGFTGHGYKYHGMFVFPVSLSDTTPEQVDFDRLEAPFRSFCEFMRTAPGPDSLAGPTLATPDSLAGPTPATSD